MNNHCSELLRNMSQFLNAWFVDNAYSSGLWLIQVAVVLYAWVYRYLIVVYLFHDEKTENYDWKALRGQEKYFEKQERRN